MLNDSIVACQARRKFLAKQLTLSQPGRQIIPTTVLPAPPDFLTLRRACVINQTRKNLNKQPQFTSAYMNGAAEAFAKNGHETL